MRILLAHNFYQQPGGEDTVFAAEAAMLREAGHDILQHTVHNDAIDGMSRLAAAARTVWNPASASQISPLIHEFRPDVVHFHNTFPLISPSSLYAAKRAGPAVLMTLHNYRLLCPAAIFQRNGQVCEDCLSTTTCWPGVAHGCYRGSRSATAAVAATITVHRVARTWHHAVDRFIALTDFARQKFIQGGLPADRIAVKPNFVHPAPSIGDGSGGYAVFAGRLSPEKGIATLLRAWKQLSDIIPLHILGEGPLAPLVSEAARQNPAIRYLGRQPSDVTLDTIGRAALLVFPSEWYEGLPCTIIEAFAKGTPVLASRLGAMIELIDPGRTGMHFTPADSADLATQTRAMLADTSHLSAMRTHARREFEARYTAAENLRMLLHIYDAAIESSQTTNRPAHPLRRFFRSGKIDKQIA